MYIVCIYTDDLSKNKVATQSKTYLISKYRAEQAVDRDITTCMRTEQIGGTSPYKTVWWKVDLGDVYNIYSVNLLFKNYAEYGILKLNTQNLHIINPKSYKTLVKTRVLWA